MRLIANVACLFVAVKCMSYTYKRGIRWYNWYDDPDTPENEKKRVDAFMRRHSDKPIQESGEKENFF
jgi:hypothetical protein